MEISITSRRRCEVLDITRNLQQACRKWGGTGLVHVYCPHTTCGVAVNEKFDPDVRKDILEWLEKAVPRDGGYRHEEGNADAHIKALFTGAHVSIPVRQGNLLLGRWQGVLFLEFDGPRSRTLWTTFITSSEKVQAGAAD